jgi:hypothetical protein
MALLPNTTRKATPTPHKLPSRRPLSFCSSDYTKLSEIEVEDSISTTITVYVGPPSPCAEKTRFVCSLWSINLLLPHFTFDPIILHTEKDSYPEILLNMSAQYSEYSMPASAHPKEYPRIAVETSLQSPNSGQSQMEASAEK